MKEKNRKSRKPLLYISQPNFQEPGHPMQSQYSSSTEHPAVSASSDAVGEEKKKSKKRRAAYNEEEEFIYQEEEIQAEKTPVPEEKPSIMPADKRPAGGGLNPVKSFTAMSIDEKIHHLTAMSQYYSCTFSTPWSKIIGKLHSADNEKIVVKTGSGEYSTIERKDLTGIRINA